ncbi:MAG: hypothetical protein ACRCUE_15110 [Bosea sp. (in: a-proteobacteria)]
MYVKPNTPALASMQREMDKIAPPAFSNEQFAAMVAKGREAWADVPDAAKWVDDQRGEESA